MEYYTWILAFHIMAFMSWMAMLFYLPRIFVYHIENKECKDYIKIAKVQEEKIYTIIGKPAMWATVISGALLLYFNPSVFSNGFWMYAKLFVVILLVAYSYSLDYFRKLLKEDKCFKSGNFFRAYNEIPTILSLLIVGYVVTKTFSILFTLITIILGSFIVYKVFNQKKKN